MNTNWVGHEQVLSMSSAAPGASARICWSGGTSAWFSVIAWAVVVSYAGSEQDEPNTETGIEPVLIVPWPGVTQPLTLSQLEQDLKDDMYGRGSMGQVESITYRLSGDRG